MAIATTLIDGEFRENTVKITSRGQLVVAPLEFSDSYAIIADATTAFNFVPPKASKRFVITDYIVEAGKTVSTTVEADVTLYEADGLTDAVGTRDILTFNLVRNQNRVLTGLNLIVTEGKWLNITTTDPTVNATIMGYYIDV
jgi:hypothetical protein